jgi:phosphoribosyl-ATP pyrophosphohydrolase
MAKSTKKNAGANRAAKKDPANKPAKKSAKKAQPKALKVAKKRGARIAAEAPVLRPIPPLSIGASAAVLDRLWAVVEGRRNANPEISHSARLLSRGTAKVAQKFGEEAVECLIEATLGHPDGVVSESADVLYHLLVLWVDAGIRPEQVWMELQRREGISGIAEKASRVRQLPVAVGLKTSKIP